MIDSTALRSLVGKHVIGQDGEKIGKIADVYESTDGGAGTFATVTTGLFGSGSSFFPLEAAELRDDDVAVPYTKDFVKDAPRVENDEELSAPEEERLFAYYRLDGTTPQDVSRHEPENTEHEEDSAETGGDRSRLGEATVAGVATTRLREGASGQEAVDQPEQGRLHDELPAVGGARLRRYVGGSVESSGGATGEQGLPRHPVTAAHLAEHPTAERPAGDERTATDRGAHVLPGAVTPDEPAPRTL